MLCVLLYKLSCFVCCSFVPPVVSRSAGVPIFSKGLLGNASFLRTNDEETALIDLTVIFKR